MKIKLIKKILEKHTDSFGTLYVFVEYTDGSKEPLEFSEGEHWILETLLNVKKGNKK